MNTHQFILQFILATSFCIAQPKVGDPMPCAFPDSISYGISSAQFAYGCKFTFDRIRYFVATTDKSRIAYVSTQDTSFRSPEGIHIGSTYQDVRRIGGTEIIAELSWAYYSQLPSGWFAQYSGFPGADSIAGISMKTDSVVQKLFRNW